MATKEEKEQARMLCAVLERDMNAIKDAFFEGMEQSQFQFTDIEKQRSWTASKARKVYDNLREVLKKYKPK